MSTKTPESGSKVYFLQEGCLSFVPPDVEKGETRGGLVIGDGLTPYGELEFLVPVGEGPKTVNDQALAIWMIEEIQALKKAIADIGRRESIMAGGEKL